MLVIDVIHSSHTIQIEAVPKIIDCGRDMPVHTRVFTSTGITETNTCLVIWATNVRTINPTMKGAECRKHIHTDFSLLETT
mmetsp:Transcript_5319/g.12072  ORF Transcript_5319/g.12072 Transcript_5319/m.12072 type:complete len:81 (+) Transcript_5319:35-277(+)